MHTVHLPLLPLFDHQHTKEFPIIFLNDVLVECLRSIKPCYYSNTITCKNNLWESTFGRQSLRNCARMHCELVHGVRVAGEEVSSPLLCSARLRIKGGGSGGAQCGLTSGPSLQPQYRAANSSQVRYLFLQDVSPDF